MVHCNMPTWEELAIYDCQFIYVKGELNTVTDSLSRFPFHHSSSSTHADTSAKHPSLSPPYSHSSLLNVSPSSPLSCVASLTISSSPTPSDTTYSIKMDEDWVNKIRESYTADPWCAKLLSASRRMPDLVVRNGLWFVKDCLLVPSNCGVREHIFCLAHDSLGHFGFSKTYEVIKSSYFWPNMCKDLEEGYVPSCMECQCNKSSTSKPAGPLHPLPVPDEHCDLVALDFIGPLPVDDGFDYVLTITDRLNSDIHIIPTSSRITAEKLAVLFFDHWYCENGLPLELISDHDKLFMSRFWKHLILLMGVKHKCSPATEPFQGTYFCKGSHSTGTHGCCGCEG